MITLADLIEARERIAPFLVPTPLEPATSIGANVWLKLEHNNQTHSFKVRGALNALLCLSDDQRKAGIVTASSGNHAQAVAYVSAMLGISARILMPTYAARRKIAGVTHYGAQAVLFGDDFAITEAEALRISRDEGLTYISPYNHPRVVAGAGTIALEIFDTLPTIERIIVPVGGGGLISGIGLGIKSLKPSVEVIGVNPAVSPDMYNYFYDVQEPSSPETLADALPGEIEAGSITLDLVRRYVDQMVRVSESSIAAAIRWAISDQGWLAEGGGVVGIAALQSGKVALGGVTVVVISGGNIDASVVARVLAK